MADGTPFSPLPSFPPRPARPTGQLVRALRQSLGIEQPKLPNFASVATSKLHTPPSTKLINLHSHQLRVPRTYSVRVIRSGQMRGNKIRTRSGPHNSATSVSLQARRTETPRQKRQTNPCLRHASRLPAVSTRFYKGLESHQGRSAELSSRKYICTTAASW